MVSSYGVQQCCVKSLTLTAKAGTCRCFSSLSLPLSKCPPASFHLFFFSLLSFPLVTFLLLQDPLCPLSFVISPSCLLASHYSLSSPLNSTPLLSPPPLSSFHLLSSLLLPLSSPVLSLSHFSLFAVCPEV